MASPHRPHGAGSKEQSDALPFVETVRPRQPRGGSVVACASSGASRKRPRRGAHSSEANSPRGEPRPARRLEMAQSPATRRRSLGGGFWRRSLRRRGVAGDAHLDGPRPLGQPAVPGAGAPSRLLRQWNVRGHGGRAGRDRDQPHVPGRVDVDGKELLPNLGSINRQIPRWPVRRGWGGGHADVARRHFVDGALDTGLYLERRHLWPGALRRGWFQPFVRRQHRDLPRRCHLDQP